MFALVNRWYQPNRKKASPIKIFSSKSTRQTAAPAHAKARPAPKKAAASKAAARVKPEPVRETVNVTAAEDRVRKVKKKKKAAKRRKGFVVFFCIIAVLAGLYTFVVYTNVPFIKNLRDAYIETAMQTMSHHWLAELFFPDDVIADVMSRVNNATEKQQGIESEWTHKVEERDDGNFYELFDEIDKSSLESYLKSHPEYDKKSLMELDINEAGLDDNGTTIKTKQGDQVLAINVKEGVLLVRIKGSGYQGVLAVLKDSSKMRCCAAAHIGGYGELLEDFVPRCNGIIGVNASGFYDPDGVGNGGTVDGLAICEGKEYGYHVTYGRKRMEFRTDDKMYIVDADTSVASNVRDAVEFSPALIVDGKALIDEQSGFRSIQPRTVIAQAKDGDVMMLVIEGRLVGRSLGIGLPDCTEILLRYDAYQAMNMDGGTSSVMWYDGEYVTKCSNPAITCRYMPNAWIYG